MEPNLFCYNMDFDSYLQVNTNLENVKRNYNKAQEGQQASLEMEDTMCRLYGNSIFGNRKLLEGLDSGIPTDNEVQLIEKAIFGNEKYLDGLGVDIKIGEALPLDVLSPQHRELSTLNYFSGGKYKEKYYGKTKI